MHYTTLHCPINMGHNIILIEFYNSVNNIQSYSPALTLQAVDNAYNKYIYLKNDYLFVKILIGSMFSIKNKPKEDDSCYGIFYHVRPASSWKSYPNVQS